MNCALVEVTLKSVRFDKKSPNGQISPVLFAHLSTPCRVVPTVHQVSERPEPQSTRRRVAATVGLTLLEVLRTQDLPSEVLESEDPSVTMPRRLGLSDVIDRRIRAYREEVRRRGRMSDEELGDLIRLVVRRPDSAEVLYRAGCLLSGGKGRESGSLGGFLPTPVRFALARRAVSQRLRRLLGRRLGTFGTGPFTMESRENVLIQSDPSGDACHLVTGLAESILRRRIGPRSRLAHDKCKARQDPMCRWTVLQEEGAADSERVRDLLLEPEPRTG